MGSTTQIGGGGHALSLLCILNLVPIDIYTYGTINTMKWSLLLLFVLCSSIAYSTCQNIGDSEGITLDRTTNITRVGDSLSIYLDANATTGDSLCRVTTTWNDYVIMDYVEPRKVCEDDCCTEKDYLYTLAFGKDELIMHDGKLRYKLPIDNRYQVGESYELLVECGTEICYKIPFQVDVGRVPFSTEIYNTIWAVALDPLGWIYTFIVITVAIIVFRKYLAQVGIKFLKRIGILG